MWLFLAWADVMINSARPDLFHGGSASALAAAARRGTDYQREEGKALRRHVSALAEALSAALGTPEGRFFHFSGRDR